MGVGCWTIGDYALLRGKHEQGRIQVPDYSGEVSQRSLMVEPHCADYGCEMVVTGHRHHDATLLIDYLFEALAPWSRNLTVAPLKLALRWLTRPASFSGFQLIRGHGSKPADSSEFADEAMHQSKGYQIH